MNTVESVFAASSAVDRVLVCMVRTNDRTSGRVRRVRRSRFRRTVLFGDFHGIDTSEGLWSSSQEPGDEGALDVDTTVRSVIADVLTARQRRVVEMFFFEGHSQGEIARELGITQQVVHKCLYGDSRGGRIVGGALSRLKTALIPVLQSTASAEGR